MPRPDFAAVCEYMLTWLRKDLSRRLYYHNAEHTVNDVLQAVHYLAVAEGVNGDELNLVKTAVVFHDAGYLRQYLDNEKIGVEIAEQTLPQFGYSARQISLVSELIMATALPQRPVNLLEKIMCDADLDSLGRDDFFVTSHSLRLERIAFGFPFSVREWYQVQLAFLRSHRYFTDTAKARRDPVKRRNIEEIVQLLGVGSS